MNDIRRVWHCVKLVSFDGWAIRILTMRLDWFDWTTQFRQQPIVKVDGQLIKNVTIADDVLGFVKHVKANKIVTVTGNVEIIGQRI